MSNAPYGKLIAEIPPEVMDAILNIMKEKGQIPMTDMDLAENGYSNIIIGIAPWSLWGYELTLVLKLENERRRMNVPKSAEVGIDEAVKLSRRRIAMLSEQARAAHEAYVKLTDSLHSEQRHYNSLLLKKAGLGPHPNDDPR